MVDINNFMTELEAIGNTGKYNVQPKLKPVKPKVLNMKTPNLPAAKYTSTGGVGGISGGGGGNQLDRLINAIRGQESNNNYSAVNSLSGASGAYQIMKANFVGPGGWDREALGRDISYQEFMNNKNIQDTIARYKLNQYLNKYGAAGAAVAWYGGPGAVKNMHSRTPQAGGHPSIYAYWNSVLSKM